MTQLDLLDSPRLNELIRRIELKLDHLKARNASEPEDNAYFDVADLYRTCATYLSGCNADAFMAEDQRRIVEAFEKVWEAIEEGRQNRDRVWRERVLYGSSRFAQQCKTEGCAFIAMSFGHCRWCREKIIAGETPGE